MHDIPCTQLQSNYLLTPPPPALRGKGTPPRETTIGVTGALAEPPKAIASTLEGGREATGVFLRLNISDSLCRATWTSVRQQSIVPAQHSRTLGACCVRSLITKSLNWITCEQARHHPKVNDCMCTWLNLLKHFRPSPILVIELHLVHAQLREIC